MKSHMNVGIESGQSVIVAIQGRSERSPHRVQLGAEEQIVEVDALEADVVVHGAHAEPSLLQDVIFSNLQQVPVGRDAAHGRRQLVVRQRIQRQVDAAAVGLQRGSQPCQRDLYRRCSAAWPSACRPPASPAPGRRRGRWSVGKQHHEETRLVCCRFAPLTGVHAVQCSTLSPTAWYSPVVQHKTLLHVTASSSTIVQGDWGDPTRKPGAVGIASCEST